jgi:nitrogen fixation protein NifU and related proteins
MKYNELIGEYYGKNEHIGSFESEDNSIGTGLVGAPACGDVMKLQIKVENDKIIDAKVMIFGCGSAMASSTKGVEMIAGKTLTEASEIKNIDIADALGLPAIKMHCSVLMESAIKRAIDDYINKNHEKTHEEVAISNAQEEKFNDNFSLSISNNALSYIEKVLSKNTKEYIGIRLDLEESGCGLTYKVRLVESSSNITDNTVFTASNGLKIYIKHDIAGIVNGTTMDFKEEGLKSGIIFINPNEIGKCDCGMNFKLEGTKTNSSEKC